MGYTREQIRSKAKDYSSDMSLFYKKGFINYRGKTTDTGEYYTEIISEWLVEHLELLEEIKAITRRSSYFVKGHDGIPDNPNSNRGEELIAMAIKRQGSLNCIGKVLDYQTPLKNSKSDKAGKIDILAYDGAVLRILELKEPDSRETMLRCVLEGYTYLKTADITKLIDDFNLPKGTRLEASPFVFYGGYQWKEMQQNRPWLKRLIEHLNIKVYYINQENNNYIVEK